VLLNETVFEDPLPGIVSFSLLFNLSASPALLVEYLRSWMNYGRAVAWVTKGAPLKDFVAEADDSDVITYRKAAAAQQDLEWSARRALGVAAVSRKFRQTCLQHAAKQRFKAAQDADERVRYSPDCVHILAGTWSDPATLEGFWEDRSSQVTVHRVFGRPRLERDVYVPGRPLAVHLDPDAGLFVRRSPHERVHVAAREELELQEGEVHIMMVPWSTEDDPGRRIFKITGLGSC
jgi:hypothetical protein